MTLILTSLNKKICYLTLSLVIPFTRVIASLAEKLKGIYYLKKYFSRLLLKTDRFFDMFFSFGIRNLNSKVLCCFAFQVKIKLSTLWQNVLNLNDHVINKMLFVISPSSSSKVTVFHYIWEKKY